jgi:hypothetical protein
MKWHQVALLSLSYSLSGSSLLQAKPSFSPLRRKPPKRICPRRLFSRREKSACQAGTGAAAGEISPRIQTLPGCGV